MEEFLRRIPKVELHCHLEGAVRPETLADLARRNGVPLPADRAEDLLHVSRPRQFLEIYEFVCRTLVSREDFARVAYESLEDGVVSGNLRYREMFFDPTLHTRRGVVYQVIVDGLLDGIRAAESDFGVQGACSPRCTGKIPSATAEQMLEDILRERRDEVIGLGMDGDELRDPPEKFTEVFRKAANAGLRLTAHAAHDSPASYVTTDLTSLGASASTMAYHVLDDPLVLGRVRAEKSRSRPPSDARRFAAGRPRSRERRSGPCSTRA